MSVSAQLHALPNKTDAGDGLAAPDPQRSVIGVENERAEDYIQDLLVDTAGAGVSGVFIHCLQLALLRPTYRSKFAFSGAWFNEEFHIGSAGLTLDQPTVGKFFLWTSVMSCLACTIILILCVVVDANRHAAWRWVNVGATVLLALVLIELLAPTFLLIQYVVSMGMTLRRFLGLCLCCGFWILLPSVVFRTWKANPTMTAGIRRPLAWAFAVSLVVPTYYLIPILHSFSWHSDTIMHTALFMLAWIILVAPMPCIIWLTTGKNETNK